MSPPRPLRVERLDGDHYLGSFDSGKDELDTWLRRHALAVQQMDSGRTFVVTDGAEIVGYFSLTIGSVRGADAPARLVRGLLAYPVGMVLLARLAVHRRHQGQGLGATLLAEALRKAVTAGDAAAARLVVVDATDDNAVSFSKRYDLIAAPEHDRRLYRSMKDIRASRPPTADRRRSGAPPGTLSPPARRLDTHDPGSRSAVRSPGCDQVSSLVGD